MPLNERLCDRRSFLHHFFSFFSMTHLCSARRLTANGKLKIFRGTSEEPLHRPPGFPQPILSPLKSVQQTYSCSRRHTVPSPTMSPDSRTHSIFMRLIRHQINYSQSDRKSTRLNSSH